MRACDKKLPKRGFTLPELMVVMTISTLLSGILLLMYTQARTQLQRGVARTTLQQKVRQASIRIIPKITSSVWELSTPNEPQLGHPIKSVILDTENPENNQVVLWTTKEFIDKQLRKSTISEFNPRETDQYAELRIFLSNERGEDPKAADLGERIDVYVDGNTPGNTADDVLLASGLSAVTFTRRADNTIRLRVEARGYVPTPGDPHAIKTETYETDVYLPVTTNSGGT